MKKPFYIFILFCFLSPSTQAQTRHLIKTNILYNQLPFSAKQKLYFFNQYQLVHQNKWILGLGYGKSKQSGIRPETDEWLMKFDPGSEVDYTYNEFFQNAELALSYNCFSEIPHTTLNFGLGLGYVWNKYSYVDRLELLNQSIMFISNNERNTSLFYTAFNAAFAETIKERFQIGINFQLKFSPAYKVSEATYFYHSRNVNKFSDVQLKEKFTLAPTFGVSFGYFLNKKKVKQLNPNYSF